MAEFIFKWPKIMDEYSYLNLEKAEYLRAINFTKQNVLYLLNVSSQK
jgi:hypothetical protein